MNLIKLFLPKEKIKVVTEVESWTVSWQVRTGWSNNTKVQYKVFINEKDAEMFEDQLKKQAEFIGCWISTDMYKN